MAPKTDTVRIFDTTLRDGEQSPGIALNAAREGRDRPPARAARRGHHRGRLRDLLARRGGGRARRLAGRRVRRRVALPHQRRGRRRRHRVAVGRPQSAHPRLHRNIRHPSRAQAADDAATQVVAGAGRAVARAKAFASDVEFSCEDATRSDPDFMAQVVRAAIAAGATTINIPDTVGYTVPERVRRRSCSGLYERVPELDGRHPVGALPRRPGPGRRQLDRRRRGGRAAGRVHDQRHRRARRQRIAGGDRDAAGTRAAALRRRYATSTPRRSFVRHDWSRALTGYVGAAQQGDRRPKRLRARGRHPPARRAGAPADVRDHGRRVGRPGRLGHRAGQALRPPRAAPGARRPGLHHRGRRAEAGVPPLQGDRRSQEAKITSLDLEAIASDSLREREDDLPAGVAGDLDPHRRAAGRGRGHRGPATTTSRRPARDGRRPGGRGVRAPSAS